MKIIKRLKGTGGFTLIEIIIVLAIIAVMAGILTPILTRYIGSAKLRRAEMDVRAIANSIGAFYGDTLKWPIWQNGSRTGPRDRKFRVLGGPGALPDFGRSGFRRPDEELADQLIRNRPNYPTRGKEAWRGPYLESVEKDPWGNKYLVNVEFLWPQNLGGTRPVFVISAGPNGRIDTYYSQRGPNIQIGGDDIVFRLK